MPLACTVLSVDKCVSVIMDVRAFPSTATVNYRVAQRRALCPAKRLLCAALSAIQRRSLRMESTFNGLLVMTATMQLLQTAGSTLMSSDCRCRKRCCCIGDSMGASDSTPT